MHTHTHTMEHMDRLYESPFAIPREDMQALLSSDGFQLLRSCLANDADFCDFHAASDTQTRQTWLLHRDLLHALVMPVVELQRRAEALASTALGTAKSEDLELAFAGDARGAFLFLHCFATEEGEEADWCRTRGCPACVTTATLSTESHVRLTMAASLVSTASTPSPPSSPTPSASSSRASSPETEDPPPSPSPPAPSPTPSPSLPPIPHILPALRAALAADPFWGPTYWPYFLSRATQLAGGIRALIADCVGLEALPATAVASATTTTTMTTAERGVRVRRSRMARRLGRIEGEETAYLRRCAMQTWARAAMPE
ncbi:hypothetical protein P171DRAFT_123163, partial [Karstenula rhodostoma CBS 690.94]